MITNKDIAQVLADEPVESSTTETQPETPIVETPPTGDEPQETPVAEEPAKEPAPEEPKTEVPGETKEEPAPSEPSTPSPEQKPRPSRAERKIQRQARTIHTLEEQLAAFGGRTHEFQPKGAELVPGENGEVDIAQLDRYIGERSQQAVTTILQQERQFQEYKESVLDWADDLSETIANTPELNPEHADYNPELEALLHDTLQKANFDAQGNPDPKLYASEIWEQMSKGIQKSVAKARTEAEATAATKLQQQVDEGAITPSSTKLPQASALTEEEKAELQATNPRKYTEMVQKGLIQ